MVKTEITMREVRTLALMRIKDLSRSAFLPSRKRTCPCSYIEHSLGSDLSAMSAHLR